MSADPAISVRIIDGPIARMHPPHATGAPHAGIGATVVFHGLVRAEEDGQPIRALEYEVYEPMASRMLRELAADIAAAHGAGVIGVEHARGEIRVGECSFRLTVGAPHRAEALRAMEEFIDRMKRDVPIWKTPVWA